MYVRSHLCMYMYMRVCVRMYVQTHVADASFENEQEKLVSEPGKRKNVFHSNKRGEE